jgi:hypothetical protein
VTTEAILQIEHLSRPQAIARIRERLLLWTDDEHCACVAAGRLGAFCQGFRSLSDAELRSRFHWIARKRPGLSREELESLASLYHTARQQVAGATVCCDLETRDHCACDGWNMFDNDALASFCRELTGSPVRIE